MGHPWAAVRNGAGELDSPSESPLLGDLLQPTTDMPVGGCWELAASFPVEILLVVQVVIARGEVSSNSVGDFRYQNRSCQPTLNSLKPQVRNQ